MDKMQNFGINLYKLELPYWGSSTKISGNKEELSKIKLFVIWQNNMNIWNFDNFVQMSMDFPSWVMFVMVTKKKKSIFAFTKTTN